MLTSCNLTELNAIMHASNVAILRVDARLIRRSTTSIDKGAQTEPVAPLQQRRESLRSPLKNAPQIGLWAPLPISPRSRPQARPIGARFRLACRDSRTYAPERCRLNGTSHLFDRRTFHLQRLTHDLQLRNHHWRARTLCNETLLHSVGALHGRG